MTSAKTERGNHYCHGEMVMSEVGALFTINSPISTPLQPLPLTDGAKGQCREEYVMVIHFQYMRRWSAGSSVWLAASPQQHNNAEL